MSEFSEILYTALASPLGIEVETNNPETLRAKLYAARRADPALEPLSIHLSPTSPSTALFIIRRPDATEEAHPEPS